MTSAMDFPKLPDEVYYRVYYRRVLPDGSKGRWELHIDEIQSKKSALKTADHVRRHGCYYWRNCEAIVVKALVSFEVMEKVAIINEERSIEINSKKGDVK